MVGGNALADLGKVGILDLEGKRAALEAGVGKATSQALYKPLSEDNRNKINSIMSATNRFYRKTGYIYSATVIIFAVVYCLFVKTSLSKAVIS